MGAYAYLDEDFDPWESVDDLDGEAHYRVLGVPVRSSPEDIKAAYRSAIRTHHPDKGGDPAKFSILQTAWETLSDPVKRQTYDDWAKQVKYRYIPGVTQKAEGGEDILLDEFDRIGLNCDATSQLVVLCEVCGRPSTKTCFICECSFCDFCTRKQHWKGKFGLHWPMVNKPIMKIALAKKELEKKRIEDAKRLLLEDPNYREEGELKEIRGFKRAAQELYERHDAKVHYDVKLAKYYCWAQTARFVYVSVFVPSGYADKQLHFQAEDSPPIVNRAWAYELDESQPMETFKTKDNRLFTLAVAKKNAGQHWDMVFRGDSSGARCLKQPYRLVEQTDEVIMEIKVPFWMDKDDIKVDIDMHRIKVEVRGELSLERTFWEDASEADKDNYPGVVAPDECLWSLDDEVDDDGEDIKMLMITLMKRPVTDEEREWKKSKRMDNQDKKRIDRRNAKGVRFFEDDEDYFNLEDMLQALCFLEAGEAWVPAKPWDVYHFPYATDKMATDVNALSKGAREQLNRMLEDDDES